jgi:2-hydroxycyclohexanecarboxyl-CoA dehydrogenase
MLTSVLASRVAMVTASTSGIGKQIALQMAAAGARAIILNGRNEETGRAVEAELRTQAPETEVLFVAADLTDPPQVDRLFKQAVDRFGQLDILVHCGGAQVRPDLFANIDPASFRPLIDGHFVSLLTCCHHAVPLMMARGEGAIVVVASDAGKIATPGESIIGATKAAAIMFVRTLALEASRHGIRVNCITPSIVRDTKSYDRVMSGELSRRVFEKAERRARLGVPTPEDIAPLAVFLASPLAGRITGQAVSVNGGISAA